MASELTKAVRVGNTWLIITTEALKVTGYRKLVLKLEEKISSF